MLPSSLNENKMRGRLFLDKPDKPDKPDKKPDKPKTNAYEKAKYGS